MYGSPSCVCDLGVIPGRLFGYPPEPIMTPRGPVTVCPESVGGWHTILSSIFLHGGWLHLILNMWTLWIFGPAMEARCGRMGFLALYIGGALVALQLPISAFAFWADDAGKGGKTDKPGAKGFLAAMR